MTTTFWLSQGSGLPHAAVAHETQAASQPEGSEGPQVSLHFSDTSHQIVHSG
jgi:hypothetical protein